MALRHVLGQKHSELVDKMKSSASYRIGCAERRSGSHKTTGKAQQEIEKGQETMAQRQSFEEPAKAPKIEDLSYLDVTIAQNRDGS